MGDDDQQRYYDRYSRDDDKQSDYYDHYAKTLTGGQPSKRSRVRPIVAGVVVGVLVACVAVFFLVRQNSGSSAAASSTTHSTTTSANTSASPSSTPSSSAASSASASSSGVAASAPAGWTVVPNDQLAADGMSYAVPPGWVAHQAGYVSAWGSSESDPNLIGGHAVADKDAGSCKADSTYAAAVTGIHGRGSDPRPAATAQAFALQLAAAVSEDAQGKPAASIPAPQETQVTIAHGKSAMQATVTVPLAAPVKCGGKTAKITVVSASSAGGNPGIWFAVTDPSAKDVTEADLNSIIRTITVP